MAVVENITKHGLCALLDEPLSEGLQVQLRMRDSNVPASVRHCSRSGSEYRIGIEFAPPYEWATDQSGLKASPRSDRLDGAKVLRPTSLSGSGH